MEKSTTTDRVYIFVSGVWLEVFSPTEPSRIAEWRISMKTTLHGHDVVFSNVGGPYPYSLSVDGLHISSYDAFDAAERRAHAICELSE